MNPGDTPPADPLMVCSILFILHTFYTFHNLLSTIVFTGRKHYNLSGNVDIIQFRLAI